MPDYQKGLIYKWVCDDCDEVYIGSTTNFTERKAKHKFNCTNEKTKNHNLKIYQTMRENGGFGNWRMIQVEAYPCQSKRELEAKEEEIRKEFKAKLNAKRAFRTEEERKEEQEHYNQLYYKENIEKMKEKMKNYYENNKEKIKERGSKWREENADKRTEYDKKRYENNKEKINEMDKKYKENHKEKLLQKYNCECGGKYIYSNKSTHFKTKLHQNYINSI